LTAIHETEGLVLRKLPFSETSLIFYLLTPGEGHLHFLLKGALRQGKRRFPAVDMFRRVQVQYAESRRSDLLTARGVDLVQAHDRIASTPAHYRTACWLGQLALGNAVPHDPAPRLYAAVGTAFARLAGARLPDVRPVWLAVVFVLLQEQGLLPVLDGRDPKAAHLQRMLKYAEDVDAAVPEHSAATWADLAAWAIRYLRHVDLRVPEGALPPSAD
jgi:DNA repair protein RecO